MIRFAGAAGATVCLSVAGLAGVWAQTPAPAGAQVPQGRRYVALGCVDREAAAPAGRGAPASTGARFIITDQRGDKPTIYRLSGDAKELEFHVGHTVEVSGPLSAAPANAAGPNANAMTLTIATLAYISPTCKILK